MRNCTAAIGDPVTIELVTKDKFENLRRESCVVAKSTDSCCLNATLRLDSVDGRNSTVSTKPGVVGQTWTEQEISIKDTKDGTFIVDVTQQVKTTATLSIFATLGNSNKSFATERELSFVAKDCEDKQCRTKCASDRDRPTCMERCQTRKVGTDGNCLCRPNYGLKKGWMKGQATDGTDCYTGNSIKSAKEGCCRICPGGTHNLNASLNECEECPNYQTSKEGSDCTSCSIGQVWNRIWPPDASADLKRDFPKGRYCQTCDRGTYIVSSTAMCENATEQDQCNACKVCPEGACCPGGNTVVAKKGYWEEDDQEKCKTTAYWQEGRCILFHSTNASMPPFVRFL